MKRTPVTSSNVVSIGYEDSVLEVEFKSGVYRYFDVAPEVYQTLMIAPSVGKAINAIKSNYRFEKVAA